MRRLLISLHLVIFPLLLIGCESPADDDGGDVEAVSITDNGTHYAVTLDYASGLSPREMGEAYGAAILEAAPNFEADLDAYIAYLSLQFDYDEGMRRVGELKDQIPADYREEIEGLGAAMSADADVPGDGLLSPNEVYALNLLSDIRRTCQCSGLGVYGSASDEGGPLVARLLDWDGGGLLSRFHAVVTIRKDVGSVCLIGYLGHLGAITAVDDDGVFAGVLDSPTGRPYEVEGRRSYVLDLRYALETCDNLDDVAAHLADGSRDYCYNHNILLADTDGVAVLENNFSGWGDNMHRALRYDDSALNAGVEWNHDDATAVVNSFVLKGNHDNHTDAPWNTVRWQYFSQAIDDNGPTIDRLELKSIATGDVYNPGNCQHLTVFEPQTLELEVMFKPVGGGGGVFETITPDF
ncbi:MAG: hypothetical protein GF403_06470 [Candidatus Coatesbacteria bacterium]|nr:hypothetical protein [Candidatus Coatesbacteria bacterium]